MLMFFVWYVFLTLLGWLAFPLAYHLFPALRGRGYAFSRTLGLFLWGYLFWMGTSLRVMRNDPGGLFFALFLLGGISVFAARTSLNEMKAWVRARRSYLLNVEILFFAAFAFLTLLHAANPDIVGTEEPMELAFINAILRSPTFPPHDPWLSGYAISYYYFGYVMTAALAMLTAALGSVAFNLMVALVFALSAVGAYGILYSLLGERGEARAWFAPFFLVLAGNVEGVLELFHQRGWLGAEFWAWLNIKDLNAPPISQSWIPQRMWWWWRASRVVQDFDLAGNFQEVIDEFPFFSYLLGDLHPHVLAMPFALLAVAAALNLFRGGWQGEISLFGARLRISLEGFFFTALLLGGLAFLNTWDILVAAALLAGAYTLTRVRAENWSWARVEDFLLFGFAGGVAGFLLYLPFYFGFSSQAGGILPNLVTPTRGAHLWVMFGILLPPIFLWLLSLRGKGIPVWGKTAFALTFGLVAALWAFSWLLAWILSLLRPESASVLLLSQGFEHGGGFFAAATMRRLQYLGGLLTLVAAIGGALAFLLPIHLPEENAEDSSRGFVFLLILLGGLLVLAPEFVYLRDQFGTRMNTVFKFYYQAWMLWSLAAAFGAAKIFDARGKIAAKTGISLVLLAALVYPVMGVWTRTNGFHPPYGWTLDGAAHLQRENADEAAAIFALYQAPMGVVAEAVGGSYSGYARVSTYTGLPTVLGWMGHEAQWRGGYEEQGTRAADIQTLYMTSDWREASAILTQYHIRYVFIGTMERAAYHVNEDKFSWHLPLWLKIGEVEVYVVP